MWPTQTTRMCKRNVINCHKYHAANAALAPSYNHVIMYQGLWLTKSIDPSIVPAPLSPPPDDLFIIYFTIICESVVSFISCDSWVVVASPSLPFPSAPQAPVCTYLGYLGNTAIADNNSVVVVAVERNRRFFCCCCFCWRVLCSCLDFRGLIHHRIVNRLCPCCGCCYCCIIGLRSRE
jgi:hypothetical protein